jgi:protein SCO1
VKSYLSTSRSLLILFASAIFFASVFVVLILQQSTLSNLSKKINLDPTLTLHDHNGNLVSSEHFKGKPLVLFFGFTHCPEICPTTINDILIWLDEVGTIAEKISINFVTVDPERDTAEELNKYIEIFSSRIVGITGTQIELNKLFTAFGVYAQKVPLDDNGYTVDHSSSIYLVDINGRIFDVISFGEHSESAIEKLKSFLN